MTKIIRRVTRPMRRRLQRVVQKSKDRDYVRRAMAILFLSEGTTSTETAHQVCAARGSVQYWKHLFETEGESGLVPQRRGRTPRTVDDALLERLQNLLSATPRDYGYLRSRWTSELLALELLRQMGVKIHASTVRRWLPRLGFGWRRARPTIYKRDPHKNKRLRAIGRALTRRRRGTEVFYLDEADVDLNPRIGSAWMARGKQAAIPTPGQNRKRYIAGALHAHTGKVVWVDWESKNSLLFIRLLYELKRTYRAAKRLVLILDNYRIHKSHVARRWLANNPKVTLLFQPAYHPWVNRIERLWRVLHDTVTRNHRFETLEQLMNAVSQFMTAVQPFPGNNAALASS